MRDTDLLRRFSANERKYLVGENAIFVSLAESRLSEDDPHKLGMRTAARCCVELSQDTHD